jgi:hypothetical protein
MGDGVLKRLLLQFPAATNVSCRVDGGHVLLYKRMLLCCLAPPGMVTSRPRTCIIIKTQTLGLRTGAFSKYRHIKSRHGRVRSKLGLFAGGHRGASSIWKQHVSEVW